MGIYIIAEAGVNHNGSLETALKLVDAAAEAGCDAVKFQTFKAERLVGKKAEKAQYQIKNTGSSETQYQMLKKLELSFDEFSYLFKYCRDKGICPLSTPFDEQSADELENLDMSLFKISSGDITNMPFIKHISRKKRPVVLSTGMSTLGEIEEALGWVYSEGIIDISLLHCTTNYPTNPEEVNLMAMLTLKNAFKTPVGYSDHTQGIEIPCAAAALGAQIIEKHFTLNKTMDGPDHKASLEPDELKNMVRAVRNIEKALGDGIKRPSEGELKNINIARKSITSLKDIKPGEILTMNNITVKRPGTGLEPKHINLLLGRKAVKFIAADEKVGFADVE